MEDEENTRETLRQITETRCWRDEPGVTESTMRKSQVQFWFLKPAVATELPSLCGMAVTSANLPNIHPETKVLIIERLKTRSTADVADTFNVSQRQVQRIKKRFEETGDVFDKPRSGRPHKTTAREDRLLARKSKAGPFSTAEELHETWSPEVPVSTRTVCLEMASMVESVPRSQH
ncbi:hypothetical protein QQF64_016960 [Cirrhinus molitorella]|uniref:Insertion element IS150 protein InsJ-like helix-turn-helix domain-containing protein n=1 Tax=Cirrhinus molitorella TaxID=172907 RepID=A0ABR3LRM5_9TELE